jgi:hypothetical protein
MSPRLIVSFILIIFLQLFFFNAITLYDTAFAFVFVMVLLFLPMDWNYKLVITIAFLIGIFIDISTLKIGIHASTSILIVTLRGFWINAITPQINPNDRPNFKPYAQNLSWIVSYIVPLVFFYSLIYHILSDLQFTLNTFWKFFATGFYSSSLILLIYMLFIKTSDKK